MPRRDGPVVPLESLSVDARLAADPGDCQFYWYALAARLGIEAACRTALDVGAGWGLGMDMLRAAGLQVTGLDPVPLRPDISPCSVLREPDRSADLVVACDVIEHVEDDAGFLRALLRVARRAVFVSTPNYALSRCLNPHHVREYTADELAALLAAAGVSAWQAWTAGPERQPEPVPCLADARHNFGLWIPR